MMLLNKRKGFALVESLLSAAIVAVFFAGLLGFLSVYRRAETNGNVSSQVDTWMRDRARTYQSNSLKVPASTTSLLIPSSYVGDSTVSITENASVVGIPVGYTGLQKLSITANWTTPSGTNSSRSLSFMVYQP